MTCATPEGTARFAERTRRGPHHFRSALGLSLSSLGLGSYLGPADDATDAGYGASVRKSLELGVNVVDCAINYRHQRSERALGKGLAAAFAAGTAKRDEVFFCTKAGYLPFDGALPDNAHEWLFKTWIESGVASPSEIVSGCHCIAPGYLRDQAARSLRNTGLETIDVMYVHNPEQQLEEVDRGEFLKRWRRACEALEGLAAEKKIQVYGAATWAGLRTPPTEPAHLPLEAMVEAAHDAGGKDHRFRVLQLPYNLALPEASFAPTQPVGGQVMPVTEAARRLGLVCFASVPLMQAKLIGRIHAGHKTIFGNVRTDAHRALQFVRATPGFVAPLAGSKDPAHVEENAEVLTQAPPDWDTIVAAMRT